MSKRKPADVISTSLPKRRRGADVSTRIATSKRGGSILKKPTWHMEDQRRHEEKKGLRRLGFKVHDREHREPQENTLEGELQNNINIKEHPYMNQRQDGTSPNESELPYLNPEARLEYENRQREEALEKQLRLGHTPKMGSTPEYKP